MHPAINPKGDDWIIAQLEETLRRRPSNANFNRGRMVFDFKTSRVVVEAAS